MYYGGGQELMICHVIRPDDLSDEELTTNPDSIRKMSISHIVLRRCVRMCARACVLVYAVYMYVTRLARWL